MGHIALHSMIHRRCLWPLHSGIWSTYGNSEISQDLLTIVSCHVTERGCSEISYSSKHCRCTTHSQIMNRCHKVKYKQHYYHQYLHIQIEEADGPEWLTPLRGSLKMLVSWFLDDEFLQTKLVWCSYGRMLCICVMVWMLEWCRADFMLLYMYIYNDFFGPINCCIYEI